MAFAQKLFTSLQNYNNPDTRIGELNRIWYDSNTNVFRIQLDKTTPGGTVIGGSSTDLSGYATLTTTQTLTNKTLTSPTITDGVFQTSFTIGNQIFYEHGYNGFSVNENFDIVGVSNFTGYHYTSGAGRDGVAFTLARTGQFTDGFGIHGTASGNEFVIGSETGNTDFVFKKSIGMPFDVSGGTTIFKIGRDGSLTFPDATVQTTAYTGNATTATTLQTARNINGVSFNGSADITIKPRVSTPAVAGTYAIDTDSFDMVVITGQNINITNVTTTGTPTNGQKLWFSVTGTAARTILFNSGNFESSTVTLPTTTVTTNRLDVGFVWNAATSKWRCVAQA